VRAIVGLVLAAVLAVAGCHSGPDAKHFVAILDELDVPAGWQPVRDQVRGPDQEDRCDPIVTKTMCPGANRSFVVAADPSEAYAQAKTVAEAAGFAVTAEFDPACDGIDGTACQCFTTRDDERVRISVFRSPENAGLGNAGPGVSAVVITAERSITAG
jgi:hypothetical protein